MALTKQMTEIRTQMSSPNNRFHITDDDRQCPVLLSSTAPRTIVIYGGESSYRNRSFFSMRASGGVVTATTVFGYLFHDETMPIIDIILYYVNIIRINVLYIHVFASDLL